MIRHLAAFCGLSACLLASGVSDAARLISEKRVPEARLILEPYVAAHPNDVGAILQLGQCEERMQDYSAAVSTLAKAAVLAPARADVQLAYGETCLQAARAEHSLALIHKGTQALQQAVRLSPKLIRPHEVLLMYYSSAPWFVGGSMSKAQNEADAIGKLDPDRGLAAHVILLRKQGENEKAFALCRSELAKRPSSFTALYEMGRIAALSGRHLKEGEDALATCLRIAPSQKNADIAGIHLYRGLIFKEEGRRTEARASLKRGLEIDPNDERLTSAISSLGPN